MQIQKGENIISGKRKKYAREYVKVNFAKFCLSIDRLINPKMNLKHSQST